VGERGSAYKFALKSFKNILQIALELWVSTWNATSKFDFWY
jgi:hypothetical protein